MRRNRKVKKNSVLGRGAVGAVFLVILIVGMTTMYYLLQSRCDLVHREIAKAEKRFATLESEYVREAARWDEMKIPERLAEKLTRFGLEMRYARQDQVVRMNGDGRPAPGQLSVARARNRARTRLDMAALAVPQPATRPAAAAKVRGTRR